MKSKAEGKTREKRLRVLASIAAACSIIMAAAGILFVFYALSNTDKASINLNDSDDESYGWSYEVWDGKEKRKTKPVFLEEYDCNIPDKLVKALKLTREMSEELEGAKLSVSIYGIGIDVFLDDQLLYSDFSGEPRKSDRYITPSEEELARFQDMDRSVSFSLPLDYVGKKLSVIYYYPENFELDYLTNYIYPQLDNLYTASANLVIESTLPVAMITVMSIVMLILVCIFTAGVYEGKREWRVLLLAAYYLCLMFETAATSLIGDFSLLPAGWNGTLIRALEVIPLFSFLGITLYSGWRKRAIITTSIVLGLYDIVVFAIPGNEFLNYRTVEQGMMNFGFVLLLIILWIFENHSVPDMRRKPRAVWHGLFALAVLLLVSVWESIHLEHYKFYWPNIFVSIYYGNFRPFNRLITAFAAIFVTTFLIRNFIVEIVQTRNRMYAYKLRSQMAVERFEQLKELSDLTRSMQHEMRHHALVLSGLLKDQEYEKAFRYADAMEERVTGLPPVKYCEHLLVNLIAGVYLERMKAQKTEVTYELILPETLTVEDIDLSMLLTNILENAAEASENIPEGQKRFVHLNMHMEGEMLYLSCRNSMSVHPVEKKGFFITSKQDSHNHGFGTGVIQKIIRKYDGVMRTELGKNEFCLRLFLRVR